MPNSNEDLPMSAQMTEDLSLKLFNDQFSDENRLFNAEEWLEENYPQHGVCQIDQENEWEGTYNNYGKERKEIIHLGFEQKNLTGFLDLSAFSNLQYFSCWGNQLTSLNCTNNPHLEKLWCFNNQLNEIILATNNQLTSINVADNLLTAFNYAILNPATLTYLALYNNNLEATDIAVFSYLVNLVRLEIGNENEWVQAGEGNQFYGSLSSLKNCTKLKYLGIQILILIQV